MHVNVNTDDVRREKDVYAKIVIQFSILEAKNVDFIVRLKTNCGSS